ncbi:MAG: hypothetical protein ACTH2Q_17615 [Propionibacteriaceae bacterium]
MTSPRVTITYCTRCTWLLRDLKRRVRDLVAPEKSLGHADKE